MDVHVLVKGRFERLSDVKTLSVGPNAWELDISLSNLPRRLRRGPTAEEWDGAIFLVDGVETEPAVGTGESKGRVRVTALVLD